eukprot:snap_masked-scaffold_18-processed-gene-2.23-mRNA-1 protein AED:1.00 eAED:1.00 QI:0/0/0/0/1/1/2/0/462
MKIGKDAGFQETEVLLEDCKRNLNEIKKKKIQKRVTPLSKKETKAVPCSLQNNIKPVKQKKKFIEGEMKINEKDSNIMTSESLINLENEQNFNKIFTNAQWENNLAKAVLQIYKTAKKEVKHRGESKECNPAKAKNIKNFRPVWTSGTGDFFPQWCTLNIILPNSSHCTSAEFLGALIHGVDTCQESHILCNQLQTLRNQHQFQAYLKLVGNSLASFSRLNLINEMKQHEYSKVFKETELRLWRQFVNLAINFAESLIKTKKFVRGLKILKLVENAFFLHGDAECPFPVNLQDALDPPYFHLYWSFLCDGLSFYYYSVKKLNMAKTYNLKSRKLVKLFLRNLPTQFRSAGRKIFDENNVRFNSHLSCIQYRNQLVKNELASKASLICIKTLKSQIEEAFAYEEGKNSIRTNETLVFLTEKEETNVIPLIASLALEYYNLMIQELENPKLYARRNQKNVVIKQ